jgi:hypothetical protein
VTIGTVAVAAENTRNVNRLDGGSSCTGAAVLSPRI